MGEPVVLVHAGALAEWFKPLLQEQDLTGRYQVVSYHRFGYVGSSHVAGPVSIGQQAARLAGADALLRDRAGAPRRPFLRWDQRYATGAGCPRRGAVTSPGGSRSEVWGGVFPLRAAPGAIARLVPARRGVRPARCDASAARAESPRHGPGAGGLLRTSLAVGIDLIAGRVGSTLTMPSANGMLTKLAPASRRDGKQTHGKES